MLCKDLIFQLRVLKVWECSIFKIMPTAHETYYAASTVLHASFHSSMDEQMAGENCFM